MKIFLACLLAGISIAAFIALWVWVVRRELYIKKKAVEAARYQLIASKQAHLRARDGPKEKEAQEIMERSRSVYDQSVQLYNGTLRKPWNRMPAFLLGFRQENETN